jgi:subtilisin family serine protease
MPLSLAPHAARGAHSGRLLAIAVAAAVALTLLLPAPDVLGDAAAQDSPPAVHVIVSLGEPLSSSRGNRDLADVRSRTAEARSRFLAALSQDEFRVTHAYAAVSAISGVANARALTRIARTPGVESVTIDRPMYASLAESVAFIGADVAHANGYTGAGAVVAVLDTGVEAGHPDLAGKIVGEQCYLEVACPAPPHPALDGNGHGTYITGVIASQGAVSSVGVAPGASIRAYKVLGDNGSGRLSDFTAAIDDIINAHPEVDVVNLSLGDGASHAAGTCDDDVPALTAALQLLRARGTAVFAAAGNQGFKSGINYPACVSNVTSVGMVYDSSGPGIGWARCTDPPAAPDDVSCISNSDPGLDLMAPGIQITAPALNGSVIVQSGTSAAAAHAAGAAALIRGAHPNISGPQLVGILRYTGVQVFDTISGVQSPRLDVVAALAESSCGDADVDELTDCREAAIGTNPLNPDTDGDNCRDGLEVANQGVKEPDDPLDRRDFPDFDADGRVDFDDFEFFASVWTTTNSIADLDSDGRVEFDDFELFVAAWTRKCP